MVTISKFSYENLRYVNLLKRRSRQEKVSEEFKESVKKLAITFLDFTKDNYR